MWFLYLLCFLPENLSAREPMETFKEESIFAESSYPKTPKRYFSDHDHVCFDVSFYRQLNFKKRPRVMRDETEMVESENRVVREI